MSITGGSVRFEDAVKKPVANTDPQYFPTRRVAVELFFDTEADLDLASARAVSKVAELLTGVAQAAIVQQQPGPQPEAAPQTTTRTRRTKAQIEADEKAAAAGQQTGSAGGAQTSGGDGFPEVEQAPEPAPPTASAAGDEWDVPAQDVTDDALIKAVTEKNGALQAQGMTAEAAPVPIRELIASYNPDPSKSFGIKNIPPEKRADFLSKLGAIKKK